MNLNFKPNVIVIWTHTNIQIATAFCQTCKELVPNYVPTVTGGMEGVHDSDSGHYYGRALDFRSSDLPANGVLKEAIQSRVQTILGKDYLCLIEPDHFHLQRNKNTF